MKRLVLSMTAAGLAITASMANAANDYNANYYSDNYSTNYNSAPESYPTQNAPVKKNKNRDVQFYVQGEAGWVSQGYGYSALIEGWPDIESDTSNIAGGAAIGILFPIGSGNGIDAHVGAQVGYVYYGTAKLQLAEADLLDTRTMAADALAIAKISFGKFNIIAGAGIAYLFNKVTTYEAPSIQKSDDNASENINNFGAAMVFGVSYNITDNIAAGVQFKTVTGNKLDLRKYYFENDSYWGRLHIRDLSINTIMATVSYTL